MSFWGRIFGTEKALNTAIEGVKNGIDALVYTDEERATDAAKDRAEGRAMVVQWMQATQGQNLARRLIALSVTAVWLLQHIVSQALNLAAVWADDAVKLAEAASVMKSGASDMNAPVMLILTFYFAAPHMGKVAEAVTNKFVGSVNKAQ